jgi:geranylgeranyl diphosphate synthase type I
MEERALAFFREQRKIIGGRLDDILNRKSGDLGGPHLWGRDLIERLRAFCFLGKMIRGGLIILAYRLYRPELSDAVLDMAAAVEIMHSSLLIHDDIMDRDATRRGEPSIFHQYRLLGEQRGYSDPLHFGTSFGICAGDIGFFLAWELLTSLDMEPAIRMGIQQRWSAELASVGLAQMQDMHMGFEDRVTEEEVMRLYLHKTARYTFSLPLVTGALAADTEEAVSSLGWLEKIGERMGLVFQLKDDELDLFGSTEQTGKPVGADVEQGKKTLYWLYLTRLLDGEERSSGELSGTDGPALHRALKKERLDASDLELIRGIAEDRGIRRKVETRMRQLSRSAEMTIRRLPGDEAYRDMLLSILRYNLHRKA